MKNKFNPFSIMKRLLNGWDLGGDGDEISLRNSKQKIKFDININTKDGIMFAAYVN